MKVKIEKHSRQFRHENDWLFLSATDDKDNWVNIVINVPDGHSHEDLEMLVTNSEGTTLEGKT